MMMIDMMMIVIMMMIMRIILVIETDLIYKSIYIFFFFYALNLSRRQKSEFCTSAVGAVGRFTRTDQVACSGGS